MDRGQKVTLAMDRGRELSIQKKFYKNWIKTFIVGEIDGDVGSVGDITSNIVLGNGNKREAIIYSRTDGVIAGIEEVSFLLKTSGLKIETLAKDGSKISQGEIIFRISGNEKTILRVERSALDILSRMSGIATLTKNIVKSVKKKIMIAPTRKTQWRYLDKKAVSVGGGLTHRLALWESILIKDNHLSALIASGKDRVIYRAINDAWKEHKKSVFIEVEVKTLTEAIAAAQSYKEVCDPTYPCFIMLDKMKPSQVSKVIRELQKLNLYEHVLIEVSGGITPENIVSYSDCGADVASLGYLTTKNPSLDIKLRIV